MHWCHSSLVVSSMSSHDRDTDLGVDNLHRTCQLKTGCYTNSRYQHNHKPNSEMGQHSEALKSSVAAVLRYCSVLRYSPGSRPPLVARPSAALQAHQPRPDPLEHRDRLVVAQPVQPLAVHRQDLVTCRAALHSLGRQEGDNVPIPQTGTC